MGLRIVRLRLDGQTELFDRLVQYRNRELGHGAAGRRAGDVRRGLVGGGVGMVVSVPLAVGISALEIIVVLVQAYVFTLLTAVFMGMAIHAHH